MELAACTWTQPPNPTRPEFRVTGACLFLPDPEPGPVNFGSPVPVCNPPEPSKAHMHALHPGHSGGLFAGAASPFLLSLPSFFFFSLSPPILSPFLFPKTSLGKHAPGRQPCGWYGGHLGSVCGLWTRVKHPYCAQKLQNRSFGEAKTQKSTKSSVARKPRKFEKIR